MHHLFAVSTLPLVHLISQRVPLTLGLPRWLSIKNPSAMQEMQVQPLGREDPLERAMATHSSILGLPR